MTVTVCGVETFNVLVVTLTPSVRRAGLPPLRKAVGEKSMVRVQVDAAASTVLEVQSVGAGVFSGKSVGKLTAEKLRAEQ